MQFTSTPYTLYNSIVLDCDARTEVTLLYDEKYTSPALKNPR